jgi:hypothetical protein
MSKGFRVFLHILQALALLGALWYLYFTFAAAYDNEGLSEGEAQHINTWIVGLTLVSIALSPQLWSSARSRNPYEHNEDHGRYESVPTPMPQQQPGGVFEPMNSSIAPAPPASSYGQPSAGGITPTSSPQAGSPWNQGR